MQRNYFLRRFPTSPGYAALFDDEPGTKPLAINVEPGAAEIEQVPAAITRAMHDISKRPDVKLIPELSMSFEMSRIDETARCFCPQG